MPLPARSVIDTRFTFFASYKIKQYCRSPRGSQKHVFVARAVEILEVQPTCIKQEKKASALTRTSEVARSPMHAAYIRRRTTQCSSSGRAIRTSLCSPGDGGPLLLTGLRRMFVC